jgi:hypothetical protein
VHSPRRDPRPGTPARLWLVIALLIGVASGNTESQATPDPCSVASVQRNAEAMEKGFIRWYVLITQVNPFRRETSPRFMALVAAEHGKSERQSL